MLQSMRQLAHSWVVKGLMLLLMVSFSIWGIGDIFRGNPMEKTVAKVGKTNISVQQLNHLFEATLAQARQKMMPDLTAQQAKQMGLLDKALDNEINRALIDQDIKRLGIDVSPKEVLALLADQPQFRMKDGTFNKVLFAQLLAQQQLTESSFLTQGQQDISRKILLSALDGNPVVPQTTINALYSARAQKRVLDVVTIDTTKIKDVSTPDDKALHDFYDANTALFTAPEYRGLTIAALSTDDIAKDIKVSDDQVKKDYDDKSEQLSHPEQRDILQVVVQDEAKAKQITSAARASSNLLEAAKNAKETAIPLDQVEETNLMPELSKVVFSMHSGEISDPVKTQLGWHIIQLQKITPAGKPTFESVKDKLRNDMEHDQAIEAVTRSVNELDDQLAAGHSLDDIADGLKLRLIKIPAIDVKGTTPDGKIPSEFPDKEQMLKDAFAQNTAETSPIEDDKAGHYYVVRTDDITPSTPKPFDSVKAQVTDAWKAHQQMMKAQAFAQQINKDLQDGKPLASFADQNAVSVRTSLPLSLLDDTDPLLPHSVITQAFRIKKGETTTGTDGNKIVVARLASITDVPSASDDIHKNKIEGEIKQATSDELLDQYIQYLHTVFPVKINAELVGQMRQQDN